MDCFDVVIIGGGPGGYVAAIRARQLGLSVALVENDQLGGTCLNWGCIPTKSLLKSAHLFQTAHHLRSFGVETSQIIAHIEEMVRRSRLIATQLAKGVHSLLKKNRVAIYKAWGTLGEKRNDMRLVALFQPQEPHLTDHPLTGQPNFIGAKHVILATGAHSRTLFSPMNGLWSCREAMTTSSIPASLLIIGAGAIGIEFASFYQSLGTSVSVVEQQDRILPLEDEEVSLLAQQELTAQGIHFYLGHSVTHLHENEQLVALLKNVKTQEELAWRGDRVLTAIGIKGCVQGLGLENTKVQIKHDHIITQASGQTHEPYVYAIGDVAGPPWLAHKASHEGVACVEFIAKGTLDTLDATCIPNCIYSAPQIASVGLTEKQAAQRTEIKVGRFPFYANGQALAQGEKAGLVKIIFDKKTGELLGAHLVGSGVTELIHGLTLAKKLEATEADLKEVVFPHPTLSEMIHEAILDADGMALHMPPA